MKSSVRFASSFRLISLASATVALGAAFAIACSSSDSTSPAPTGDAGASTSDGGGTGAGTGTDGSTGTIGASEPDSGSGDDNDNDGAAGDDGGGAVTCPAINGSYSLLVPAASPASSSECPSDTDTCTFATDPTTCKFTGSCAESGQTFDTTLDSTGKISYTEVYEAGAPIGTVTGNCTLQFSSDKATLAGSCTFDSFVTCYASGAALAGSDGGVILDASAD